MASRKKIYFPVQKSRKLISKRKNDLDLWDEQTTNSGWRLYSTYKLFAI